MNYATAAAELRGLRRELRDVRFANGTADIQDWQELSAEQFRDDFYAQVWQGVWNRPEPLNPS